MEFLRKIWSGGGKWGFKGEWNCCSQEMHGFQLCSLSSLFQSHLGSQSHDGEFRCCSWFLLPGSSELLHPLPAPSCVFPSPPWHSSWCLADLVQGRCTLITCQKQVCCMWGGGSEQDLLSTRAVAKRISGGNMREETSSFWCPLEWFTPHLSFIPRPKISDVYAPFHLRGKIVLGQSKMKSRCIYCQHLWDHSCREKASG